MAFTESIASRAVGQFPISVATSLALESALGIHELIEPKPATPPILGYGGLWVNLRTLFRNFIGALPAGAAEGIGGNEAGMAILEEMEMIVSIIRGSAPRTKVTFYVSNYRDMERKYRHYALIRGDSTPKQKYYTSVQAEAIQYILNARPPELDVRGFEMGLKSVDKFNCMILTHYAYDLLSWKEFTKLTLLESHTGAIKERPMWYTKYYNGKDLAMIPFNEGFLQIFGDSETFRPNNIRWRKTLIELGEKNRWSALTTKEKLRTNIETLPDKYFVSVLRELLK